MLQDNTDVLQVTVRIHSEDRSQDFPGVVNIGKVRLGGQGVRLGRYIGNRVNLCYHQMHEHFAYVVATVTQITISKQIASRRSMII